MRQRVREVMIYAGPRMLLRHPVLALLHLVVDERRPAPAKPVRNPQSPLTSATSSNLPDTRETLSR